MVKLCSVQFRAIGLFFTLGVILSIGAVLELDNVCTSFDSPSTSQVGEGDGTPLQYSCLENPMDGGAWWAAVHGVAKSQND